MPKENLKTVAYAMPSDQLNKLARDLRANGYTTERNRSAGTFTAKADNEVVVRAMTVRGSHWLVRADPRVVQTGT